jgi:hypothetical protein
VRLEAAFDVGTPTAPPVRLAGGSSAERWRLTTDRGRWMVKVTAPPPAWQRQEMRDVNRRNVLVTVHGPVLLDFDYAGPEVPWWEVVHHAFDLTSPPQPALVGAVLAAHPDRRLAAAALVRDQAAALPAILSSLDRWCRLLR